jgi:8-amino-7-oxononanoate synthase
VFSVDGDTAPLTELLTVARRHGAALVVDDAHGLGVVGVGGRGAAHAAGLAGQPDVVVTMTLSKSLGSQGGVVLGSAAVIAHLVDVGRPFIFDTGLAPAPAGAALAALDLLCAAPELAERVRANAGLVAATARRHGFAPPPSDCAVVAVPLGAADDAVAAAATCAAYGVRVGCFRPPSTPDPVSRLRVTARADLTAADLRLLDAALAAVAAR